MAYFRVDEYGHGADLNGDGDMSGYVVHVYDSTTGVTTNLGLAVPSRSPSYIEAEGNLAILVVYESEQGNTDLNGDGDTWDSVLHVYNHSTGTITNLGVV